MSEDLVTERLKGNIVPATESVLRGIREFSRKATKNELGVLKRTVGPEAFKKLIDKKLDIGTEIESEHGVTTYVVPYDTRVITLVHSPWLGLLDVSFELTGDYLARKSGKFVKDEGFAVVSEKIQPGTIDFMKFMGDFLSKISNDCTVRIIADERRMKLYKAFVDKLVKPNVVLSPKSFKIGVGELDNEY